MNRLNQVKRMILLIQSNQSINPIYLLTFFGKSSISLTFFGKCSISLNFFEKHLISLTLSWDILNQFNWCNHTSPSKLIDSVTYFMQTNWLSHQSTHLEKERNRFNQFCRKMSRFKSINSVELIGMQVWTSSSLIFDGGQVKVGRNKARFFK